MIVTIGQEILSDSSPQAIGRMGIVLADPLGDLIIVTSRDFLVHCGDVKIEKDEKVYTIGTRPTRYYPTEIDPSLASNLLGWFTPNSEITLDMGSLSECEMSTMQTVFMENLIIGASDQGAATGFVTKVDCFADFEISEGEPSQLIDGLIRVKNVGGTGVFATEGSAGALVTTVDGSLVGFVVGLLDDGALVAPLKELCEHESLTVATSQQIELHNSCVGTAPTAEYANVELPEPIVKILDVIAPASELQIPVRQIVAEWLHEGWNDVVTDQPKNAFAPYSEYFRDVDHDLYTLDEAFTLFVEAELGWESDDSEPIGDHLTAGYLDFIGIINTDHEIEVSEGGVEGSHDRVLRHAEVKDAA